jgi:hypothetical protein
VNGFTGFVKRAGRRGIFIRTLHGRRRPVDGKSDSGLKALRSLFQSLASRTFQIEERKLHGQ